MIAMKDKISLSMGGGGATIQNTAAAPIQNTAAAPIQNSAAAPIQNSAAAPVENTAASAPVQDTVEVPTPSGSHDFKASYVQLPPEVPGEHTHTHTIQLPATLP